MNSDILFDAFSDIDEEYIKVSAVPKKNNYLSPLKTGIAAALILILFTPLCSSSHTVSNTDLPCNTPYTIQFIDGKLCLKFSDSAPPSDSSTELPREPAVNEHYSSCGIYIYVHFNSIYDLRNSFLTGNFDEEEIKYFEMVCNRSKGNPVIPNLSNLYSPTLPFGLSVTSVRWSGGEGYHYIYCSNRTSTTGTVKVITEEEYHTYFANEFDPETSNTYQHEVVKEKTIIRNATIVYHGDMYKEIFYSLYSLSGDKVYVNETYDNVNDDVPSSIFMLGSSNGAYFTVHITNCSVRPSVLWLASFGLIPIQ